MSSPKKSDSGPHEHRALLLSLALASTLLPGSGCASIHDVPRVSGVRQHPAVLSSPDADILPATIAQTQTIDGNPIILALPAEPALSAIDPATLPDLWSRIRHGFQLPDIDIPDIDQFANRFARMGFIERLAPRARRYLYLLVIEAEKRKIPTELALLPIIESGLNPHAHSPANAVGLCQFIPATGRRFGLHQSAFSDRRKDLACIHGMFDYLESNAAMFGGDWLLALAAYNWGEGAVTRAIDRNRRNNLPTVYRNLRMPEETRAYVPQLLAIKHLIADPDRYGTRLPHIDNKPSLACDASVPKDIDVDKAASFAGVSSAEFRTLNPGIKKGVIPKATYPTICLPFEAAVRFAVNVSEHKGQLATWTSHTVPNRTTLVALAKQYRTTPDVIRSANEIPRGMRLKAGSTVLVPRARSDSDIPLQVAISAITAVEPDVPDTRKVVVKVKRKDTLVLIAKRHRVSPQALRQWNPGIREPLQTGQKLVLHVPVKSNQNAAVHIKNADAMHTRNRTS